jgi:predicted AlkP superfamily pyrophosphatase or phosphodiesterase
VLGAAAAALAAALPAAAAGAGRAAGEERPALLVLLVVDQLTRGRLDPALPGGLGRLLREGRVFADATLAHGITETCPGHAAISTGRHPGHAGIPGNHVFESGRPRYCVEGGSLAFLRGDTLADRVRAAGGDAVAVSGKDRAALLLAGRGGLAIWLDPAAGFVAGRRAGTPPPPWVESFDAARGLAPFDPARLPASWSHPGDDPRAFPDATPSEDARFSRTSPHPVRGATLAETVARLLATPVADALTLDLAREAVTAERLGAGPAADLLAVSLSATDYVGHLYGPDSQEALAALGALDGQVGAFLAFLEARVGRGSLLVALTADHGVTRNPELAEALGVSECRVPGGRVPGAGLAARIAALAREACRLPAAPEVTTDGDLSFALPAEAWKACRAPRSEVVAAVAAGLAAAPGVVKAWTAPDLAGPGCAGPCALFRASFDPERSGDWVVQLDPTCVPAGGTTGASHGSPYLPDRAVPVVFWGGGVTAGIVRGPAHTVDVAPTLAGRAGLAAVPVDGRALHLR